MKRDLPSYVVRIKGVLYFKRRRWPTRKFENQSINDKFYAEYASILNNVAPAPKAFLVRGLIENYQRSARFESLKPRTQADYNKFLSRFEKNAGTVEVNTIKRKNIIAWQNQLAKKETPHFSNYWLRVVRLLLEHAIDLDVISENPAKGVKAIKYRTKKANPWPSDKIAAARAAFSPDHRTRLLFEMLYCSGQRIGDVLKAEWSDIKGAEIHFDQGKVNSSLDLPITEDLAECLRLAPRYKGTNTILANAKGTGAWSYRGAHDAMMKLRIAVGAEEHGFHDMRHTVAAEIAGSGGSDEDVMSVTGHKTIRMAAHYSASTRQKTRAKKAQLVREQNKNGS